jgi:hypothetical protein
MGAVADAVGDVFSSVGDVVSDVFDAVGDVVDVVVDVVADVVDTVGEVVQAVIDDPLPVLLSVAGSFVGIPPMVTMGALTAARGGDLEDIALSMGTAAIGSAVGAGFSSSVSSTFSSTFIDAGVNETFAQVAGNSITSGLINGTIAEIRGGDFEDGFVGGAIGGLVSGGVQEVANYVQPDIVNFAMENGLDLRDATAVYNAGVKAVSAGVTSEITGKNDFVTSFTTSVIGSGIDSGVRSVNQTIDQQFDSIASVWNQDGEEVDTTITGAGIPDTLVGEVQVSDIGIDTTTSDSTFDTASVLEDTFNSASGSGNTVMADANDIDDGTPLPESSVTVSQAPDAEALVDFQDLISTEGLTSDDGILADTSLDIPMDFSEVAENLPTEEDEETAEVVEGIPTGALASVSNVEQPTDLLDVTKQGETVLSEAPVTEDLLSNTLAKDKTAEQPIGGLNAVSASPLDKITAFPNIKPTDITKPIVATVGNLLKKGFTQPKRTATRPTRPVRPAGGLKTASVKPRVPTTPPKRVDVAKLIPIQKAPPTKKPTSVAPPKTLASTANLSPVNNIAGLTSLVKKVG